MLRPMVETWAGAMKVPIIAARMSSASSS